MREASRLRSTEAFVYWACRGVAAARRSTSRLETFVGGLARGALTAEASQRIIVRLYDRSHANRDLSLFRWEKAWWASSLPPPPASILVGGCGRGREVEALLARGYKVHAFDPSRDSIRECQQRNPDVAYLGWFGYERIEACNEQSLAMLLPDRPFDAVLLGWGSLSHLLDEKAQERLFAVLDTLVPSGPILTTFLRGPLPLTEGTVETLGMSLGKVVRTLTLGADARPLPRSVRCVAHMGFVYVFDERRLQRLADACNRRLELGDSGQHATFWPRGA